MRKVGLDELMMAGVMRDQIVDLKSKNKSDKLLLDVTKEAIRVLNQPRPPDRAAADAPVTVQLIHYLDRPARPAAPSSASPDYASSS